MKGKYFTEWADIGLIIDIHTFKGGIDIVEFYSQDRKQNCFYPYLKGNAGHIYYLTLNRAVAGILNAVYDTGLYDAEFKKLFADCSSKKEIKEKLKFTRKHFG